MRKGKIFLLLSWLSAVGILIVLTIYNKDNVDRFLGLTSSKETPVTFPYPVYMKKLYVEVGDRVKKGDLLAEIVRANVTTQSNLINYKIDALEAKKLQDSQKLQVKLDELVMNQKLQTAKIDSDIKEYRLKMVKNKEAEVSISGITIHMDNRNLQLKIKALNEKKKLSNEKFLLRQASIENELSKGGVPLEAGIKGLDAKKSLSLEKEKELKIFASFDGEISEIDYPKNSYAKSYTTLMKMHPVYPKYVTGFIHEDIENSLKIGQEIYVEPLSKLYNSEMVFKGKVLSISSRIEGFPIRLKKYKIVPLWGYKVLIELPENSLKLGQKVAVSTENNSNENLSNVEKVLRFLKLK